MLNNSLHTCLSSRVQYQGRKVIFFSEIPVSKPAIFFSDKCRDRAALQSWPLHSLHLFHQFKQLLVWMTAQRLLLSLRCKQFVFTLMCISLTRTSSQLVSSKKLPIEALLCYRRWCCIQYIVSPLMLHFTPSPTTLPLLLILHWEEDFHFCAPYHQWQWRKQDGGSGSHPPPLCFMPSYAAVRIPSPARGRAWIIQPLSRVLCKLVCMEISTVTGRRWILL